jgi:hypothetical protein
MPVVAPKPVRTLDEAAVVAAWTRFHEDCDRLLAEAVDDAFKLEAARLELGKARECFLTALGLAAGAKE